MSAVRSALGAARKDFKLMWAVLTPSKNQYTIKKNINK